MPLRIGIVVGEVSGDKLGADLIRHLKSYYPNIEVEGVLGPELLGIGGKQLFSMERLAVMGFVEPLFRLKELYQMRQFLTRYFIEEPPDLFIGVDAPAFNIGLEKKIHQAGIPTVHYVSPSVWAWRENRIHGIKKAVDLMLTLLPFEQEIYKKNDIPVEFVGHPAADQIPMQVNTLNARTELLMDAEGPVIALLPGSRRQELKYMVPLYVEVASRIDKSLNGNVQFVMPVISEKHANWIKDYLDSKQSKLALEIVINKTRQAISSADIALVTSGTATLEVMLHKKPMLIAYKTSWLSYLIAKALVKVPYVGLPNLLSQKFIVPEYIQTKAQAAKLTKAMLELLRSQEKQSKQIDYFTQHHQTLKKEGGQKAARAIYDLIGKEG